MNLAYVIHSSWRRGIVLLGATMGLSGCVYLHDPARQKTAEEARDEFAKLSQESLAAMHAKAAVDGGRVLAQAADLGANAQITNVLEESIAQLVQTATQTRNQAIGKIDAEKQKRNVVKEDLKAAAEKLKIAAANTQDMLGLVNAAAKQSAHFAASQSLLAWSISVLAAKDEKTRDVKELVTSFAALGDKSVTYDTFAFAADTGLTRSDATSTVRELLALPKIEENLGKLKVEDWRKLGELFGDDAKRSQAIAAIVSDPSKWKETLAAMGVDADGLAADAVALQLVAWAKPFVTDTKQRPLDDFLLKDPGASVVVASLAYDIALAQERRLRALVENARREDEMRGQLIAELSAQKDECDAMIQPGSVGVGGLSHYACDTSTSIREMLQRLCDKDWTGCNDVFPGRVDGQSPEEYRTTTVNFVLAATNEYVESVLRRSERVRLAETGLAVHYADLAATQADANMLERQALITRGIEGLVAFHSEGIRPDDIIQVAQAIALLGIWSQL